MILAPYLMWLASRLVARWRGSVTGGGGDEEEHGFRSMTGHTIVVGFGPVGKRAARALRAIGSEVVAAVDEEVTTGEELARQVVMAAGLPAECVAGGSACQLPRHLGESVGDARE